MTARLVVSVHDVAPASEQETLSWLAELDRRDIRCSLLVVPGPWRGRTLFGDDHFAALLAARVDRGDEIVQHGWRHCAGADGTGWRAVSERALARGAGEFAAISEQSALLRLRAGRAVITAAGLRAEGFTAPGWLHSPGTLRALTASGFRFTTTHAGLLDLSSGRRVPGPAFSHRPGGFGETVASRILVSGVRALARRGGLVRIALHPADLRHPELRRKTLAAIDHCLDAGVIASTYGSLLTERATGATA